MRMVVYGTTVDAVDEYVRMADSTCIDAIVRFVTALVQLFGPEYLREPNVKHTTKTLALGEARGFPGMLGSVNCMHWQWKNCLLGLHGQYKGHTKEPTIILEVVVSHNLWI